MLVQPNRFNHRNIHPLNKYKSFKEMSVIRIKEN
jgi:hypothetical protein